MSRSLRRSCRSLRRRAATLGPAFLLAASVARAQQGPGAPAKAPPGAVPDDAKKEQAKQRFDKAITLFEQSAWDAALAEFLKSRELFPTRAATKNAAVCLRKLNRFDESLELFEAALREFPNMPADDRTFIETQVKELTGLVGTIEVRGAEPGATVAVDGRPRGTIPLSAPLRVAAGTRMVRVFKDQYSPFEVRVDVAGGAVTVIEAKLSTLTESGRVRVTESTGKVLDVVVDGVVVAKTPWEGSLSPGDHWVALRGEGDLGTAPVAGKVLLNQTTALALTAAKLEVSLKIEAIPADATLQLDGVGVGKGSWEGPLPAGAHRVDVFAPGFVHQTRELNIAAGGKETVAVQLERESALPKGPPAKIAVEVVPAFLFTPGFGGDVGGEGGPGIGAAVTVHGTYHLPNHFGIGLHVGYLTAGQSGSDRSTVLQPVGLADNPGKVDDRLHLRGPMFGASAAYHTAAGTPLLFRLNVGALLAKVSDVREGTFSTTDRGPGHPPTSYPSGEISANDGATFLYVAPEVRGGFKIGPHLELNGGLTTYLLFSLKTAEWTGERNVMTAGDGLAGFPKEKLTGGVVLLVAPSVGARYEF
jgi:hypothetical protein